MKGYCYYSRKQFYHNNSPERFQFLFVNFLSKKFSHREFFSSRKGKGHDQNGHALSLWMNYKRRNQGLPVIAFNSVIGAVLTIRRDKASAFHSVKLLGCFACEPVQIILTCKFSNTQVGAGIHKISWREGSS